MHRLLGMRRVRAFTVVLSILALMALAACRPRGGSDPTGALKICTSGANGMQGTRFRLRVDAATVFTVVGGSCSSSTHVTSADGRHTITELATAGASVRSIAVRNGDPHTVNGSSVTVTVSNDGTAAHETLVTYTNVGNGNGLLKVCKQSPAPTLQGSGVTFTENNGPAFTVTAGPVRSPGCDGGTRYPVGTRVNVAELIPTNVHVSGVGVSDGRGSNANLSAGTVTATVGIGTTIVTYTDDVNRVLHLGFVEICKVAGDQFVDGLFSFDITAPGATSTAQAVTGQCSGPIQVPAGNVRVSETGRRPFVTSAFATFPSNRLVTSNTINRTATIVVPVGPSNTETVVYVTNVTQQGLFKVCTSLSANAGALANQPFAFDVSDAAGTQQLQITVPGAGETQCKFLATGLPIGSTVTASEIVPSPASFAVDDATRTLTVLPGVNTLDFTNLALGTLEVCVTAADAPTGSQTFQFTVNGGATIDVHAGLCSMPIVVPAGTATVAEVNVPASFRLTGVAAVHADDDTDAFVSGTNPVTVDVRTGSSPTNETGVTFVDAVRTGTFEVCTLSPDANLQHLTFQFTATYTDPLTGAPAVQSIGLQPGQCSAVSPPVGVQDANGNPVTVTVTETPSPGTHVSSIAVIGAGTNVSTDTATGVSSFGVGIGQTVDAYTNALDPPPGA